MMIVLHVDFVDCDEIVEIANFIHFSSSFVKDFVNCVDLSIFIG